jgi:hypothetical protein
MTPVEELHALYQQWRRLTEEEGQGIAASDWGQVEQCQSAKARLQPRIVEVSQRLAPSVHQLQFQPVVAQLLELERANRVRLDAQRGDAQARRQELDRATRHLRQLHLSYVPPARANWQSYS